MSYCETCGEFMWRGRHKCAPKWDCQIDGWNAPEWDVVHASLASEAAEKFVERYENDSAEYRVAAGQDEVTVLVKGADGVETVFIVEGETVPNYRAREVVTP